MPDFYRSLIYNQNINQKAVPVYSFLNLNDNFGLEEVKLRAQQGMIRNIIILINGQQLPSLDFNEENDRIFGRALTGISRRRDAGNLWKHEYRVFHSQSRFPSAASKLFDAYQKQAVILDVLDAKFNWEDSRAENEKALLAIIRLIREICDAAQTALPLTLGGFSRGGIFCLQMAEKLCAEFPITAVVTIDPVLAPWKEENQWVVGWGIKEKEHWHMLWEKKLPHAYMATDFFPVLKNPGVPCFNVFQRKALFAMNQVYDKAIGAAVEQAGTADRRWNQKPVGEELHCAQYDESVDCHSRMLDKYADWVVEKIQASILQ